MSSEDLVDMFSAPDGVKPGERSARLDPDRPFLFEGLEPLYATRIVRSRFVTMRDGVRLSTDFHIPLGAQLPLPVVLLRTPYGKEAGSNALPALLPEQGIIFAVQDVRGRHESEGEFIACTGQDRDDGWDMLDWLAAQSWCNGSVGTVGTSYSGETAAKLAATCHPAHKCNVIMFDGAYGAGRTRNGAYLQNGVNMLRMMFGWFRDWVPKVSFGPPPHVDREAFFARYGGIYSTQAVQQPPVDMDSHLRTLPVHDLLDRSGAAPSEFGEMMRHSNDPCDPYWKTQGFITEADRFSTPSIFLSGPLERGGSSFEDFRLFRENATSDEIRDHQYLWLTPAEHSGFARCGPGTRYGIRDLGDTSFPYYQRMIAWFGHWLRGDPLDFSSWSKVEYFQLTRNAWVQARTWPPEDVRVQPLYLQPGGGLDWTPAAEAGVDGFTYDPSDPTPSEPAGIELDLLGGGYADRREIEGRDDVLNFTSAPLTEPLRLAGPVTARLHVSSSAPDTDFVVTLSEVDEAGASVNITHGVARMRYSNGLDQRVTMEKGKIYEVEVDLWHLAIEIPAGHRIRASIASSCFPAWDRNLNTGGDNYTEVEWIVADNEVHHGPAWPSALLLPVSPS